MDTMLKRDEYGGVGYRSIAKDVSMLLLLAAKALIAPVLLVVAAIVEHKWGVAVGGWVLGLPLTSGPASFFLLTEHGPRFAENAARGTLLGLVGAGVFVAGYSLASAARGWPRSLALAGIACLSVTFGLSQVHLGLPTTMAFAVVVLGLVAMVARGPKRATAATEESAPSTTRRGLVLRMILASTVVIGVSVASTVLGSVVSGMLVSLPAITAVMVVSTHRTAGRDCARRMLRGSVAGMWGGAAFFAVIALLVTTTTPGVTYLAAAVVAALVAALSGRVAASPRRAYLPRTARPAAASSTSSAASLTVR
jgi:hypothetical protein